MSNGQLINIAAMGKYVAVIFFSLILSDLNKSGKKEQRKRTKLEKERLRGAY